MEFLDRHKEVNRLKTALNRDKSQFIVLYGRRRIGKSTLLKNILNLSRGDIYFLADRTSEASQRELLAEMIGMNISGFNNMVYPNWESLFVNLNKIIRQRVTLCLDEFPYLVQSCPSLPSVLQKLLDSKELKYDIIICGSSQHMMQGYVLKGNEPLYGRADEIVKLRPIPVSYIKEALGCDNEQAVNEFSVWGGIPRYWELRKGYGSLYSAIENLVLNANGILYEEPMRLLQDEMRDIVQASSILSFIGTGSNRLSEIASRAGKRSSDITAQLSRLRELGLIEKECPFGENEKTSKKGLYRVVDPLLCFYYKYVFPFRSLIELDASNIIMDKYQREQSLYVSREWENLCRVFVTANNLDGVLYQKASRWWGNYFNDKTGKYEPVELDVVAESFDGEHILLGECKWTSEIDAVHEVSRLRELSKGLPFIKGRQVHYALFSKGKPAMNNTEVTIFTTDDVIA